MLTLNITIIPVGTLGTNCYLLETDGGKCAIIDPGAQSEKICDLIRQKKLKPEFILLTHGHHDHIGAVKGILRGYNGLKVYIGEDDLEMLLDASKSYASMRGGDPSEFIIDNASTLKNNDTLILDGLTITAMSTPGHTKGGMVYLCDKVMFSGDTLFQYDCGRCDLYGGNYDIMKKSLRKLAELKIDYTVYPGHGDFTTLDAERKHNRYMAEACQ